MSREPKNLIRCRGCGMWRLLERVTRPCRICEEEQ